MRFFVAMILLCAILHRRNINLLMSIFRRRPAEHQLYYVLLASLFTLSANKDKVTQDKLTCFLLLSKLWLSFIASRLNQIFEKPWRTSEITSTNTQCLCCNKHAQLFFGFVKMWTCSHNTIFTNLIYHGANSPSVNETISSIHHPANDAGGNMYRLWI